MSGRSMFSRCAILGVVPLALFVEPQASAQVSSIPAKTEIVVRTGEEIKSKEADVGQEYVAVLDEPLIVNGTELAPKGADAVLRVAQLEEAGAVKGRASITLQLVAVMVNGTRVAVTTEGIKSESGSQGAKAAKTTAGGAAVGAVIGGLLGGGSGAAQGAAIGAGAGVTTAVLTGKKIKVPAESRLTFVVAADAPLP